MPYTPEIYYVELRDPETDKWSKAVRLGLPVQSAWSMGALARGREESRRTGKEFRIVNQRGVIIEAERNNNMKGIENARKRS